MYIENKNFNRYSFIYRVAGRLTTIKNIEGHFKEDKDIDKERLKNFIDNYNCLELLIKEIGLEEHVKFASLINFYNDVKETGFFETYVAYQRYIKQHMQGISQKDIDNEYDDLCYDIMFNKKTLEEIISEAVYHDAKACELIYQCATQLKVICGSSFPKRTNAMWEKYIHTINLSKRLLQAGIAENLVKKCTGITEMDRKIYDFKEGDAGTPLI